MGSIRRKQRWPTTAIALTLIVACFALNVLLYGAKLPVKVHGFVRHPQRALRHADRWATGLRESSTRAPECMSVAPKASRGVLSNPLACRTRQLSEATEHGLQVPLQAQEEPVAPNGTILVPGCRDTDSTCSTYKQQDSCLQNPGVAGMPCGAPREAMLICARNGMATRECMRRLHAVKMPSHLRGVRAACAHRDCRGGERGTPVTVCSQIVWTAFGRNCAIMLSTSAGPHFRECQHAVDRLWHSGTGQSDTEGCADCIGFGLPAH
jgi:hypothetical protein